MPDNGDLSDEFPAIATHVLESIPVGEAIAGAYFPHMIDAAHGLCHVYDQESGIPTGPSVYSIQVCMVSYLVAVLVVLGYQGVEGVAEVEEVAVEGIAGAQEPVEPCRAEHGPRRTGRPECGRR